MPQPVPIGGVMEGGTVSEVVASNNPGFAKGDIVLSRAGWQTHALSDGKGLAKIDPKLGADLDRGRRARHARHDRLYRAARYRQAAARRNRRGRRSLRRGRLGGRTDREDQGRARRRHRRRQGQMPTTSRKNSASTTASITAIPILAAKLKAACPKGIDVYFENVGGEVFEAVFPLLNAFARIPVCGLIAHYNDTQATAPKWAASMMRNVLTKRLTIRGFIVSDFAARHADFLRDMSGWVREGKVKHREFITEGLDSAPEAFMGLLKGANFGKQLVRVGPDKAMNYSPYGEKPRFLRGVSNHEATSSAASFETRPKTPLLRMRKCRTTNPYRYRPGPAP